MNTRILLYTATVIAILLFTVIYFQVKEDEQKPLTSDEIIDHSQWSIDLLISLAEQFAEKKNYERAAYYYEGASGFFKLQANAYRDKSHEAFLDQDNQAQVSNSSAAGDHFVGAADILVQAANMWIRAGNNKKAAEAYREAKKCAQESLNGLRDFRR